MYYLIFLIIIIFTSYCSNFENSFKVDLTERTRIDFGIGSSLHPLEKISAKEIDLPSEFPDSIYRLILPKKIFQKQITIYKITKNHYDLIFIDEDGNFEYKKVSSNNEFPHNSNEFSFRVYSSEDDRIFLDLILIRSSGFNSLDEHGNVHPEYVKLYNTKFPEFTGEAGTFFFISAKPLSRGSVKIGNNNFDIALFDATTNGLFNDTLAFGYFNSDLFLIDLNQDKQLSFMYESETFYLDEVFSINKNNYYVSKIDSFGCFLEIKKTNLPVSNRYIKNTSGKFPRNNKATRFEISQSFWDEIFITLNQKMINTSKYQNKYLLLNFWGEWCSPCIAEIPELVYLFENYCPDSLEIISFINVGDKNTAMKIIEKNNMNWPQIVYDNKAKKLFSVNVFPTNILVLPNGNAIKNIGVINRTFIEEKFN